MEGAARVFAGEFSMATVPLRGVSGDEGVLTPFGLPCRLLFIAGALTELVRRGTDYWTGRVADPSGVFEIRTERADPYLHEALSGLSTPCFVTILGEARPGRAAPPAPPTVKLLEITGTGRDIRDLWTIRTAEITVHRLSCLARALQTGEGDAGITTALRSYGTTETDIREMSEMVRQVLLMVRQPSREEVSEEHVREKVMAIIRESAVKTGISLDMIVEIAGQDGIDSARVREAVRALVLDDECYQPARDMFKPL